MLPRRALLSLLLLGCAASAVPAAAGPPPAFVAAYFHVQGSPDGLQGAISCLVSPEGKHVYVAAKADDAISEWSRNASTGALTALGRVLGDSQDGGDVPNFDRPQVIAQSPDGLFLYAGVGNTTATSTSGLAIFQRDPDTGALTYRGGVTDGQDGAVLARPFALEVSPDPNGSFVYAGDFSDAVEGGALNVFSRNASTGQLTRVQTLSHTPSTVDGLDKVRWLALSPDGRSLYVSSHGNNALGVYQIDAGTGMLTFAEALQHGVSGVAGLVDPWGLQVSPDGAYVYVASHGSGLDGSVDVFARDADTGELTPLDSIAQADVGFENPDDVALSPDGLRVYVTAQGELGPYDGKLAVFSRDAGTGALALLGVLTDGTDGVEGLKGALAVAASADGRSVYVASEQDEPASSMQTEKGALAAFSTVPEPYATGVAALVTLAQLSASQSRGRRKTSYRRASGVPGSGRQS